MPVVSIGAAVLYFQVPAATKSAPAAKLSAALPQATDDSVKPSSTCRRLPTMLLSPQSKAVSGTCYRFPPICFAFFGFCGTDQ